jgi:hypothetical protein
MRPIASPASAPIKYQVADDRRLSIPLAPTRVALLQQMATNARSARWPVGGDFLRRTPA